MEVKAGTTRSEAIAAAIELAKKEKNSVKIDFNGIKATVTEYSISECVYREMFGNT